ncbi:deoxyribose-phosphate aldolase [Kiritimatiellaeota bacterium B1221]|nr:deoxyribose-phosphate aldolase [Kiritimatiellaeota bacterium B1221]
MNTPTVNALAKMIDHSLLHPTMSDAEVKAGCQLAKDYAVATACVKPYHIHLALDIFAGTDVLACAVIGFPHGNSTTGIKVVEAEAAALAGAKEIDMVVNIGKVKSGDWNYVQREISLINQAVLAAGSILKVIFENDYLSENEMIRLCQICSEENVAFVKTSTGYGFVKGEDGRYSYQGATHPHLKLMRKHTADHIQIKAAGGVRTLDDLLAVRELGVTRIGATATQVMLNDAIARGLEGSLPAPRLNGETSNSPSGY